LKIGMFVVIYFAGIGGTTKLKILGNLGAKENL
jgi:hypothetical protein